MSRRTSAGRPARLVQPAQQEPPAPRELPDRRLARRLGCQPGGLTFTAPNYGVVSFDQEGVINHMELSAQRRFVIVEQAGLYLINYGVRATTGTPGFCTISYNPGGHDEAGKIPLSANTMVSGSMVRNLGAQTYVGLAVDSADNNTPVTLPASTSYSNAYLDVTLVGPYMGPGAPEA